MSTLVAVAASLGAAAAFAAATVLQARGADAVVEVESMRPRHIAVFLRAQAGVVVRAFRRRVKRIAQRLLEVRHGARSALPLANEPAVMEPVVLVL